MTMRASIHLPPSGTTGYVRTELDGETVGYLNRDYYDVVLRSEAAFNEAMGLPDAEQEAHSTPGRWVVRLRGGSALTTLHDHLSQRAG